MAGRRIPGQSLLDTLTQAPQVPWLIAAAFVVVGLVEIHAQTFLNDEGILTWIFAGVTSEAPLDMLFFLHARPPISLLYAPVAAAGLTPFLWAHTLLAALAIPLTASLARHFDHQSPNFPAALVALSPLFFAGAVGGVQNTDAMVGLLFAVWLLVNQWLIAAGLLLSLVVLGRAEIAFFALALAAYAATTPGWRRFFPAAVVIPAVYLLAGALYHGNPLWAFVYPASATSDPTIPAAERAWYGGTLSDLVATILALTPVTGVLAWTSFRDRWSLERIMSFAAIAFVFVIRILPLTHLVYIDATPRYLLPALPFFCLAVSRAVDRWGDSWRDSLLRGALLLAAASLAWVRLDGAWVGILLLAAAGTCVAAAALAWVSKRMASMTLLAATALMTVVAAVAPRQLPLLRTTHMFVGDHAQQLDAHVRWIAANVPRGGSVVTDEHLLGVWFKTHHPELDVEIRHLVTPDTQYEIRTLTNPNTRQFETLFGSSRFFYARWIFAEEVASLPGEVFFLVKADPSPRARDLSEPPFDRVEWLVKDDWLGGRLIRGATGKAAGTS